MAWRGARRRRDPQRDTASQVGEQLLNHLYYREETFFVVEGSSLRSAKATREAMACERLGECLRLTILRHPVDRVISRYWFEAVHNQTVAARPPTH